MIITLENIHKTYHDGDHNLEVLHNLNFQFPNQGSVAILGKSGIGKSTLLHLMGGLDRPTSGRLYYDNHEISALPERELSLFRGQYVGFVFQFHHLLPEFNALENVFMPLIINGTVDSVARKKAKEVLDMVGLADRINHRPGQLSGGEQQRVAIARAVVCQPAVILADEPTGNLDPETAASVTDLLFSVNKEFNNLLVVVTHSIDFAQNTDHVLEMMQGGELVKKN